MPRFAALDLGSNALRLRIVEAHAASGDREQLSLFLRRCSPAQFGSFIQSEMQRWARVAQAAGVQPE